MTQTRMTELLAEEFVFLISHMWSVFTIREQHIIHRVSAQRESASSTTLNHHGESPSLGYSGAQGRRGEDEENQWHGNSQTTRPRETQQFIKQENIPRHVGFSYGENGHPTHTLRESEENHPTHTLRESDTHTDTHTERETSQSSLSGGEMCLKTLVSLEWIKHDQCHQWTYSQTKIYPDIFNISHMITVYSL